MQIAGIRITLLLGQLKKLWMNQICDTTHVYVVTLLLSMRISTFVMLVVHVLNMLWSNMGFG
ncbi:hypothetical protein AHAS_Ahas10G0121000 [Arachis hypogaea]